MKKLKLLFIVVFVLLFNHFSKAAVGCKIPGVNTIYPNSSFYLVGVKVSGVTIGADIGINVYHLTNPLYTNVSCSTSWVNSYSLIGSGGDCLYGSPTGVLFLLGTCNNCLWGDLVNYTTTIECNLDDYSWALGLGAGVFGVFVIKRRNKL